MKIERILVSTDFSDRSAQALGHGIELAQQHSAELHLFHAIVLFEEDLVSMDDAIPDESRFRKTLADIDLIVTATHGHSGTFQGWAGPLSLHFWSS